jgi:hypothetical protein
MRADVDRRINFQRNWSPRQNSPGAKLETRKPANVPENKRVFMYELRATGLPPSLEYELLMVPTMANSPHDIQSTGDVTVDNHEGRVMDGPGDPRRVIIADPAPGEPYRFALVSKDGEHKAFITVLPNPIEGSDKGCVISIIRMMPNFELAFVRFTGFPPRSEIAFHGNSEGEVHDASLKTDEDGNADTAVLPFKKGKSKGSMEIAITSATCAPKVKFKWGSTN